MPAASEACSSPLLATLAAALALADIIVHCQDSALQHRQRKYLPVPNTTTLCDVLLDGSQVPSSTVSTPVPDAHQPLYRHSLTINVSLRCSPCHTMMSMVTHPQHARFCVQVLTLALSNCGLEDNLDNATHSTTSSLIQSSPRRLTCISCTSKDKCRHGWQCPAMGAQTSKAAPYWYTTTTINWLQSHRLAVSVQVLRVQLREDTTECAHPATAPRPHQPQKPSVQRQPADARCMQQPATHTTRTVLCR